MPIARIGCKTKQTASHILPLRICFSLWDCPTPEVDCLEVCALKRRFLLLSLPFPCAFCDDLRPTTTWSLVCAVQQEILYFFHIGFPLVRLFCTHPALRGGSAAKECTGWWEGWWALNVQSQCALFQTQVPTTRKHAAPHESTCTHTRRALSCLQLYWAARLGVSQEMVEKSAASG